MRENSLDNMRRDPKLGEMSGHGSPKVV